MAKKKRTKGQTTIYKTCTQYYRSSYMNPTKTGPALRCSERVSSSCCTSDTRHVNLVTNPAISNEQGKNRDNLLTNGTYFWSFVTQLFHNSHPTQVATVKFRSHDFNLTSRNPSFSSCLINNNSLSRKSSQVPHVSTEIYILHMQVISVRLFNHLAGKTVV